MAAPTPSLQWCIPRWSASLPAGPADPHQVPPEVAVGEPVWRGSVTALGSLGGLGGLEGDAGGVGIVFEAELGACGGNDVFDGEAELGL
jgi:hypothetical protein